ncbi:tetratricopeptide repeat protein [Desulfotomaculum copahuensis]|uniref:Uncharacterized protein n=1 Tax=Desulfotomaculum copahuensis TaxID=1838280 RepID=A0A1B7LBM8_9FIRM|nr:tetratricopeptide repeat protein [Desulfotomaculum copahuensis]OAT79900.1 hypothetical protein A6M21_14405 [Desulfotomaculum copahuensis]
MKRSYKPLIAIAVLLLLAVLAAGCGSKQAPSPPSGQAAAPAANAGADLAKNAGKFVQQADAHKDSAAAQFQAALGLYNAKKLSEAAQYYERAIKLDPKNATYLNNLGNVYRDMKNYKQAAAEYQQALKLAPHNIVSYVNLASMQATYLNDKKAALATVREGLQNNPQNKDLLTMARQFAK